MTIDKAIKILSETVKLPENFPPTQYIDAIKLGIEALGVIKEFRTGRYKTINSPLLGETEEAK